MSSAMLAGGHTGSVFCVDVQIVGDKIATGGENGELCVWTKSRQLVKKITREDDDCCCVCFSKDDTDVLYSSLGPKIVVYKLSDLDNVVDTFSFNEDEINQIVLDKKEKFLAACDDSGEVKILDIKEKRVYKTLRLKHTNICSTVVFHSRKPWDIITGGLDSKLIHWDFSRPKCLNMFNMEELQTSAPQDLESYMVNPPFVHNISISPDGSYLACALENGLVPVFNTKRKHLQELFSLHAHAQGASQVCFLTENLLISGGNDCCIIVWDLDKSSETDSAAVTNGTQTSMNGASHTNGQSETHSHLQDESNNRVSGACKVLEIQHTGKINWLKPYSVDGQQLLAVADQSSNVAILEINI